MTSPIPTFDVKPISKPKTHPLPDLTSISKGIQYTYLPSQDSIDTNLLIIFHGLGDTLKPFLDLGRSLRLPQTAILVLQGPERVPLLEEEAYQWWHSFDELGEMIRNPNPSITLKILLSILNHLTSTCTWDPASIHLFGFAQGGSCAAELALLFSTTSNSTSSSSSSTASSSSLGSLVTVSGPLLSHPTLSKKANTKVLVIGRKNEERLMGLGSFRKGFEEVSECILSGRGEGMLRGREDWEPVMKFWGKTLGRRSAMEFEKDVYEIGGGIETAKANGVEIKK